MNNAKKIAIFVLLGILSVQNVFFGIVFAENNVDTECVTCSAASYEFQTYINFQVDMLQLLRKATRKEEGKTTNTNVGLFGAGILKIPSNMIKARSSALKKGSKDLADGAKAAKIGAIMLASITTELVSKDSGGGLMILFRNKPFVREWKTLLGLDTSLHDAMRDLGMEGIWNDNVSSDLTKDLESLRQKYKKTTGNQFALFTTFDVNSSVKYKDLVNILLRLNGMMKTFISMDHNSSVNLKVIKRGGISLGVSEFLMNKMVISYACASGISACSSMWKDFADNTKVRKQISEGFEKSMSTINKANDNLSAAMLSFKSSVKDTFGDKDVAEETGLTPKQLSILRTAYGIDTTKLSKEQGIGLETLFNGNLGKNLVNSVKMKPLDFFSKENIANRKIESELRQTKRQRDKYLSLLTQKETLEFERKLKEKQNESPTKFETGMYTALDLTLKSVFLQKKEDKELFMIYSNLSVTKYFVEIGSYIHKILEKSIGTKDTKGLVKYLGNACELQCSNKGITNCYAK